MGFKQGFEKVSFSKTAGLAAQAVGLPMAAVGKLTGGGTGLGGVFTTATTGLNAVQNYRKTKALMAGATQR